MSFALGKSRFSAVRWAQDHAVVAVIGLGAFDDDDLYAALDYLWAWQPQIETLLYRQYLQRRGAPPALLLYDLTSSYLEGQHNALADYGYLATASAASSRSSSACWQTQRGKPRGCGSSPATVLIRSRSPARSASSKSGSGCRN